MDPVRFGLSIRALRRRHEWTQSQVACRAGVSQASVSRAERGEAWHLTVRTLGRIAETLGARTSFRLLWQGEALDRLLDAAHAGLVEQVVAMLRAHGWEVVPEVTFNHFGERGSIDILAWHPVHGALLVIEVKSVMPDVQALLGGVDRKHRLAPRLAAERGWTVRSVSRLVVMPDDRTVRRRVAQHAETFDLALPARTRAIRRWIAEPAAAIAGLLFVPSSRGTTARHRVARSRAPREGVSRRADGASSSGRCHVVTRD